MTPTPTAGVFLPPVMDNIYKKSKYRKVSLCGPHFVVEERKKSASLSSLIADIDDEGENRYYSSKNNKQVKIKSNSAMHFMKQSHDDLALHQRQQYRHSDNNNKKKHQSSSSLFDYDRILRQERKEFVYRLDNVPKASGKIKDFLVLSKLASGQFGRVYLAEDTVDKKKYAIKTISRDVILRKNMQTEVEAEKDYLYATNSPFIVSLIQHFEDQCRVYFVMEYVPNGDIYEHLLNHGPFSEDLARFYASQVVLALEYLHNVNLIYRDLKPENVMLDTNGYIKLVDFGFVKRVTKKTNTMVGTPAYIAPEMILHKSYDKSIDWWSFGILVYEMLAGCQITPFYDSNPNQMYLKIHSKEVTFPSSNRFPHSVVRDFIKRLLQKNPAIRLGNGDNGSKDIKNHPWFASMNWVELYRRNLTAPVRRSSQSAVVKPSHSANIPIPSTNKPVIPKYEKVSALKQSLLGVGGGSRQPTNTIQTRLRFEKMLKIR